jgi:DNA-binding CsgD family transcriptional regulator/polyhydroxyalkanoate synthesis regulator phasin
MVALSAQRPAEPSRTPRRARIPQIPRQRTNPPIGRIEVQNHVSELLASGGSVLLRGPAGIGKSTLLESIVLERPDTLVLRVSAAEVESGLPYLTLVDLFGKVLADHGVVLRGHLRAALDAALLRTAAPATAQDELAVRLAVLELLRALSGRHPVLLVIDDLPWVDEPSAGVLRFVARRLSGLPVQMIAAARVTGPNDIVPRADLCPPPCQELTLPPLGADDVADLLRTRFGDRLSRSAILRVHAASGGNPLYALELGRAVAERGEPITLDEPLPVPDRLRGLMTARIAALPEQTRASLIVAAAAARPSRELLNRTGAGSLELLSPALDAGVASLSSDGALRFSHPLLREMVYADAPLHDRTEAHARLAAAVDDPVERARHLALAHPEPDAGLADTLSDAATVARRRGAPAVAADLAQLAADRTPDLAIASVRRLDAARYAEAAGMTGEAVALANDALQHASDPTVRVSLRLLLIDLAGQDYSRVGPLLDAAYHDAGENPALAAKVRLYRGKKALYDADNSAALAEFEWAQQLAEVSGDMETLVEALVERGSLGLDENEAVSEQLLSRAAELAKTLPLTSSTILVRRIAATNLTRSGETAEGIRQLESLRVSVEDGGSVVDLSSIMIALQRAYMRAGRMADSLNAGRAAARLFGDMEVTPGPGLFTGALAELHGGNLATTAQQAGAAVEACMAASDEDWLRAAYAVLGQVALLRGDAAGAVELMRSSYDIEVRRGGPHPDVIIWHADYIEALALSGARAEASRVLDEVTKAVEEQRADMCRLGLARAAATIAATEGDTRTASAELTNALDTWARHPFPFEVARAWHTLGAIERRGHRRAAAREALVEAERRYASMGALPYRVVAQAELEKLNGPRGLGLSETEQRIVDLVRRGATNREIARATFLSVKAIEANLTRLYRRFGVRNRDQLSRAMAELPD